MMKTQNLLTLRLVVLTQILATGLVAQNYTISPFVLAGGGGTITNGTYTLSGTIGQPAVGNLSSADYVLAGGFWPGLTAAPTLSISRAGTEASLSWSGSG